MIKFLLAFQRKLGFWKTCICFCDVEIGGNIYKCAILISYNGMYYLENLHNSVKLDGPLDFNVTEYKN